jgi:uncharacterized membrane protein
MKRALAWIWSHVRGLISPFLAGLFVILPIVITIAIVAWVASTLAGWVGPETYVGKGLQQIGGGSTEAAGYLAWLIGWAIVLGGVWLLGMVVIAMGRNEMEKKFHSLVEQIPFVNILYKPVVQVVDMLKGEGQDEMQGMRVVYCAFGSEGGAGFLGLLVSDDVYRFGGQEYQIVYIPTSPVPMSGGIIFAPVASIHQVDMHVDALMQIYFSIGVMSPNVIPEKYRGGGAAQ